MASCGNDLGESQVFITHLLGAMLGAGFQSPGLTGAYNQAIRQLQSCRHQIWRAYKEGAWCGGPAAGEGRHQERFQRR